MRAKLLVVGLLGVCAVALAAPGPILISSGWDSAGDYTTTGSMSVKELNITPACTIAADDTTPSVTGCSMLVTSANTGATAITDLDLPTVGQIVTICGGSITNYSTIADGGNFNLDATFGSFLAYTDNCLTLYVKADNDYVEIGRSYGYNQALSISASSIAASGTLTFASASQYGINTAQTPDASSLSLAATSNALLIFEYADRGYDFAHPLQTNPTVFIHSANQSTTEWVSLTHNQTDAVISSGKGNILLQPAGSLEVAPLAVTTDAAPATSVIASQNPYQSPTTTASTNRNGGDIVLAPGQGKQVVGEIVPATVAGKTITLTVTAQGAVAAGVTKTEGVASPDGFACAGQTSAVCALNMLTLLNGAGAVAGCTAACIDGTCSNGQIAIGPTVGVAERCIFTTNDSTAFPLTAGDQGVAGAVIIPRGTEAAPGVRFAPSQIGFYYISDNAIGFSTGGANKGYFGNSGINSTGFVTGGTTSYFALGNRGRIYSPADGYLQVTNTSSGNGAWVNYPQTITCADSGDGNHSTCGGAQTVSSNIVQLVCSDTDGCDLTLAETNFSATVSGIVTFIGPVANHASIIRVAGAVMTSGGADVELTANDTVVFAYEPASLTWVQIAPKIENS